MRKSDIIFNTVIYALYMLLSCIVVFFAEMLAIKIVNLFIAPSALALCIIRAVIYTLGVNTILALTSYNEGYKTASFSIVGTLISAGIASLGHFIFALFFSFEAFASGGVKFIYALIKFGRSLNSPSFSGELDRIDMIPFYFLNTLIYIAVMLIFGKLGERARLRDRKDLTFNNSTDERTDNSDDDTEQ